MRLFLAEADADAPLHKLVNELLLSPMGRRDWPLRFYSAERLFSVEARARTSPPDLHAAAMNARRTRSVVVRIVAGQGISQILGS